MLRVILFSLLAGLISLTGCATPTRVNSGPIRASTFDFVAISSAKKASFAENRGDVHDLIQGAITEHLAAKGVARAAGGGDIQVAYLVIVGDNASTTAINDYFGYGRDPAGLAEKAHEAYAIDNKNPSYFQAGTLLIDVLDAKSHKLLLRNFVVAPIQPEAPMAVREARVREAVDKVLKNLRIAP